MNTAAPPARRPPQAPHDMAGHLNRAQKAAIIVQFLLNEGAEVPLATLPEPLQERLTALMGSMRYVDRKTLADVVAEFAAELEGMGLTFPRDMAGALTALDGRISAQTAARLRKEAGVRQWGDPWDQVRRADGDTLTGMLGRESPEIAAVLLSKLDVARAADLLGDLPGAVARQIACAMSQTGSVTPAAVDRIGLALATQVGDRPETAFDTGPEERVGAILTSARAAIRDDVLEGLDEADGGFAALVRRAIFTFVHVPDRLTPTDVPKVARTTDQPVLVTALAAGLAGDLAAPAQFMLDNLPRRMSEALREEIDERGTVPAAEAETAMAQVVNAIRRLEAAGEITLRTPEADPEPGG